MSDKINVLSVNIHMWLGIGYVWNCGRLIYQAMGLSLIMFILF